MDGQQFGKYDESHVITEDDLELLRLGILMSSELTPRWHVWERLKYWIVMSFTEQLLEWLWEGKPRFPTKIAIITKPSERDDDEQL